MDGTSKAVPPTVMQLGLILFSGARAGSRPSGLLSVFSASHMCLCQGGRASYNVAGRTVGSVTAMARCPVRTVIRGLVPSLSLSPSSGGKLSPLRRRTHYWLNRDTNQILVVTINEKANEVLRSPALTEMS